jgi:hypothetical protein
MGKRLLLVLAFVAGLAAASTNPASAAQAVGKTGVYKDGCGNSQIWVNGQNLGPYYLVCMPPAAPQ